MNAPVPPADILKLADAEAVLADVVGQFGAGKIIPYLGPGLAELSKPAVPMTPEALAAFFGTKVALPRRAKGNAWASAQHIESMKHRSTVSALMTEAFAPAGRADRASSLSRLAAAADDRRHLVRRRDARGARASAATGAKSRASPAPGSAKTAGIGFTTRPAPKRTARRRRRGRRSSTNLTAASRRPRTS